MSECSKTCNCESNAGMQTDGNAGNGNPTTLAATMEVAGVESIPNANVQPQTIGLSYDEP